MGRRTGLFEAVASVVSGARFRCRRPRNRGQADNPRHAALSHLARAVHPFAAQGRLLRMAPTDTSRLLSASPTSTAVSLFRQLLCCRGYSRRSTRHISYMGLTPALPGGVSPAPQDDHTLLCTAGSSLNVSVTRRHKPRGAPRSIPTVQAGGLLLPLRLSHLRLSRLSLPGTTISEQARQLWSEVTTPSHA